MNVAWSTRKKATATVITAVAVAALILGCGAAGATKAGKTGPVVLRSPDFNDAPALEYFQKRVLQLSHGALRIDPVSAWSFPKADTDLRKEKYVANGTADIGFVRTWSFDLLGVKTFQALTAPMLVDSDAVQRAVLASGIPDQMLPGLEKLGVKGLAVLANGLRKPAAVKRPLLRPADWQGISFVTPRSRGGFDAIQALGAHPVAADANLAALAGTPKLQGLDKNLAIYRDSGLDAVAPYVTANVNLWPMMYVILVNPDRFSKLTADQQKWLRQAAADAEVRSTQLVDHDDSIIRQLCGSGHATRFANASTADLAALRVAFAPAIAKLEQDPQTKSFITRIQQLKKSTASGSAPAIPTRCRVPSPKTSRALSVVRKNPASVLNGVYRVSHTRQELLAGGATAKEARDNNGLVTLRLKDGHYHYHILTPIVGPGDCDGPYTVSGKTVRFNFNVPTCKGYVVATWSLGHGQLRLHVTLANATDKVIMGGKPWKKIG